MRRFGVVVSTVCPILLFLLTFARRARSFTVEQHERSLQFHSFKSPVFAVDDVGHRSHRQQVRHPSLLRTYATPPDREMDNSRRKLLLKKASQIASVGLTVSLVAIVTRPVWAVTTSKSRSDGYPTQKSDREWKKELSSMQYYVLRQGGTENPFYSVLEKEKRPGLFYCAGCRSALFRSTDKFNSGTGWPSFARCLDGVETEQVNPLAGLLLGGGAELRCKTCGGHLGDVFADGYLFVGTPAFSTGQRYCIDGAALVFRPKEGGNDNEVRGDVPARRKDGSTPPSWLASPEIKARREDGSSE